ncbi:MAG: hypothetical protein E7220_02625 [Clostridiales bacterium]|nr:hypothetical protein [Clostridiales bacterium]
MTGSTSGNNTVRVSVTVRNTDELKAAFLTLFRQVMDDEMLVINLEEAEYGEEESRHSNAAGLSADVIE